MEAGLLRRSAQIFAPNGRSVTIAFDHGITGTNHAAMANPGNAIDDFLAAGADALLITPGLARQFAGKLTRTGVIINLDFRSGDAEYAVREAVHLGADMGKFIFTPGNPATPDSLERTCHMISVAHEYGLPMMVEPIPVSFEETSAHTVENIAKGAKITCEIGADIVKMQYRGTVEEFAEIIAKLYRPALILGGPNRGDTRGVLQDIRNAMDAGAVGVTIGRNIWEHDQPGKMVAALAAIIHGDASVDSALRELNVAVPIG